MTKTYDRPIIARANDAPYGMPLLGSKTLVVTGIERLSRNGSSEWLPLSASPTIAQLETALDPICGLDLSSPKLMAVLNATPDSFSDGGLHDDANAAIARANQMRAHGADMIDIGGESTRPGAEFVDHSAEKDRVIPVITGLKAAGFDAPISIDTRKSDVAQAAIKAGAELFNDVSALSFDADSLSVATEMQTPVCLMHASGDPKTMQDNPQYDDVVLDVFDYLAERVAICERAGLAKSQIFVDPGIGFGKSMEHNLLLLKRLSLFHMLGCPLLLGVSRKRFIGTLTSVQDAAERGPGSVAVGLHGLSQGVQMIRAHDIEMHRQAIAMFNAI